MKAFDRSLQIQGDKLKQGEAYRVYDEHCFSEGNAVDGGLSQMR